MYMRAQPKKTGNLPLIAVFASGWVMVAIAILIQFGNH